jgi:hypothetical protein
LQLRAGRDHPDGDHCAHELAVEVVEVRRRRRRRRRPADIKSDNPRQTGGGKNRFWYLQQELEVPPSEHNIP